MAVNEGCGKEEPGARDTVKKELMDLNGWLEWGWNMGDLKGKDVAKVSKQGVSEASTWCNQSRSSGLGPVLGFATY